MMQLKKNDKVKFKICTTRKRDSFHLSWDGLLTINEPITAQALETQLMVEFLSDINKPRSEQFKYRPNEVKVILSLP
jgi:hypothetical protein